MSKINTIDLFAGCGGLCEGFEQSGHYNTVAAVEWDKAPILNLRNRLSTKWGYANADEITIRFDIQRTEELINGWSEDKEYGTSKGLSYLLDKNGGKIDLIIGGPPCQAYSVAGRIRDDNQMKDDYRNYLFESYIKIVQQYKPKAFVFENVPGLLSAKPGDGKTLIVDKIKAEFKRAGYIILDKLENAVIDMSQYGIPQKRKRIIILGLREEEYGRENAKQLLEKFYFDILKKHRVEKINTVRNAIGDLPKLYPIDDEKPLVFKGKKFSHTFNVEGNITNHLPRFHSKRDIGVFKLLCEDIESGRNEYVSTDKLKELYTELTGKKSNIHKFYVLRWDEPSNLIPAHLYKDGLRHIHPDSTQARTLTVREAARLQTFPDDYEFISGSNLDYKMIGNAVPPMFAKIIADSIYTLLFE